jgi:hypothetical protein
MRPFVNKASAIASELPQFVPLSPINGEAPRKAAVGTQQARGAGTVRQRENVLHPGEDGGGGCRCVRAKPSRFHG